MRSLIILLGLVAVCHCVSLLDVAKEEWKLFKVSLYYLNHFGDQRMSDRSNQLFVRTCFLETFPKERSLCCVIIQSIPTTSIV